MKFQLKSRICSISSMIVDSAVAPNGKGFVYLISGAFIYKLVIKSQNQSLIRFAKRLEDWSPSIEIPIQMILEKKEKTNAFYLINVCINYGFDLNLSLIFNDVFSAKNEWNG